MKSSNQSQIHFEVHFHGAAAQHTHLHIHQAEAQAIQALGVSPAQSASQGPKAFQQPRALSLGPAVESETPIAGRPTRVRDTGSGLGEICAKGLISDPNATPVKIFAKIFHDLNYPIDHVPPGATQGEIRSDGRYLILAIPNARHSPMAPYPNNILVIYPVYAVSGGEAPGNPYPIAFPGMTSSQTECESGAPMEAQRFAQASAATTQQPPTFPHPQLGHAFREYLLHIPTTPENKWSLQCAYGEYQLAQPRRLVYQTANDGSQLVWTSPRCPSSSGDWRLAVRQTDQGAVAELKLCGVHGMQFEQSPVWRTDLWNPLGRNQLNPQFDGKAPALLIEPAPPAPGGQA